MYWNIDLTKQPIKPSFYLCKPNKDTIARIVDAKGSSLTIKLKGMNELTFSIPYKVTRGNQTVPNPYIHNIKYKYLIKLVYGKFESYFVIQPPSESDQDYPQIDVSCLSLEDELRGRRIRRYTKEAVTLVESIRDVLSGTNWSLNRVPEGFIGIAASRRSFEMTSKTVLEAVNEIAESFGLVAQFDTLNRFIDFYKEEEIGLNKGLIINDQKYLQSFLRESDSNDFCTRLEVFGKDNLSINRVSLTGEAYIEDFSYFLYPFARDEDKNVISHSDYMSDELAHAILDYQDLLFDNKGVFNTLLDEKSAIDEEMIQLMNELSNLKSDLRIIEDAIEVQRQYGNDTSEIEIELADKQAEIDSKNSQIAEAQSRLDAKNASISDLRFALSKKQNFTPELLYELDRFIIEQEWVDNNQYDDTMLYAAGLDEFERRKFPPMSLSVGIFNFLSSVKEQRNWDKLQLGDIIRFQKKEMGIDLRANLTEAVFDFDSDDISIVISNVTEFNDIRKRTMRMLYKAEESANLLDINKGNWNNIGAELEKYIDDQIAEAQESMNNLNRDMQRASADGFISKNEANFLKLSLQEVKAEALDLIEVAHALGITTEKTDFELALTELEIILDRWIEKDTYPIPLLLEDRALYTAGFENVQTKKTVLSDKIMDIKALIAEENAKEYIDQQIIEVNEAAALLLEQILLFSDDNILTLAEANMLSTTLSSVTKESLDIIVVATELGITTEKTDYVNALKNLEIVLYRDWLGMTQYPVEITPAIREELNNALDYVQETKSILINKIIEIQSQPGKDVDDETKKSIRNPNPINPPTIRNDGTAIDHVKNQDSSVDISFEWEFEEDTNSPINGFGVLVFSSDSPSKHEPSLTTDFVQHVDKASRSFIVTGVTANKYYTFAVVAYRNVDIAINPEGIIRSSIATSSLVTESPYRPENNIAFEGDIAGTINGLPVDRLNKQAETVIIGTEIGINGVPSSILNGADIIITAEDMLNGADIKINQAIQSIKASGGVIRLQEGYYDIGRPIKMPSNIAIIGSGKSTILKQINKATVFPNNRGLIENEDTVNGNVNITIQDIQFQMSKTAIGTTSSMNAILFNKVQESVIFNNHIANSSTNSIKVVSSVRLLITGNYLIGSRSALRIEGQSKDIIISENIMKDISYGSGGTGTIDVDGAGNIGFNIVNNSVSDCWSGIEVDGSSHIISGNKISNIAVGDGMNINSDDCEVINNVINNCTGGRGIQVFARRNNVSSNRITTTLFEGIEIRSVDNTIMNNFVLDSSTAASSNSNILVTNNRNTISSNTCRSILANSKYGIEISSTASGTIVKDNDLRTSGISGAISDAGTGTIKEGNITV